MEIKKREDIPENRQVRLTVAVDRGTWQEALMHCYTGLTALCPVEGEPTREKIEAVYGSDFLYQEAVNETYPQALVEAIGREDIAIAGTPTLTVEEIGALFAASEAAVTRCLGTGECVIGISFLSDGFARIEDGCTYLRLVLPAEGTPCRIAATAIFKGAAHPNAAKLWIEYALSPDCVNIA